MPATSLQLPANASLTTPAFGLSPRRFAWIAIAVLWGVAFVGVAGAMLNYSDLDPATGAWITLADDLAHGTLYRPLIDATGTGGTRYMPLAFAVHAIFIRLGCDAITSGFVLGLIWCAALVAGVYRLLRALRLPYEMALIGAGLVLMTGGVQSAITAIKGDLAAATLNVWALVVFIDWSRKHRGDWPVLAATLFALAFMTKVTTIFGAAAAFAVLVFDRRYRDALRLTGLTMFFALAMVQIAQLASGGRFIESILACGGARGSIGYFLSTPQLFFNQIATFDRPFMFTMPTAVGMVVLGRHAWRDRPLPVAMALTTFAATYVILGSPGTSRNHLIDLHVALMVVCVVAASSLRNRAAISYGMPGLLALGAALVATSLLPQTWHPYDRRNINAVLAELADVRGPIFSEQPLFALMRDERPYCLDWFSFLTVTAKYPQLREGLWTDVEQQHFGAIVFLQDSTDRCDFIHATDTPFMPHLLKYYRLAARKGGYCIFRPISR